MTKGPASLALLALGGIPLVAEGADLAEITLSALEHSGEHLADGDVVAIAQKIVSKAEGRLVDLASVVASAQAIDIGMWLALLMAFNVWFIIWPNQKKALGIVQVEPEAKTKAARMAMLTSRFNTMLSIPMLYMMVAQQNGGI